MSQNFQLVLAVAVIAGIGILLALLPHRRSAPVGQTKEKAPVERRQPKEWASGKGGTAKTIDGTFKILWDLVIWMFVAVFALAVFSIIFWPLYIAGGGHWPDSDSTSHPGQRMSPQTARANGFREGEIGIAQLLARKAGDQIVHTFIMTWKKPFWPTPAEVRYLQAYGASGTVFDDIQAHDARWSAGGKTPTLAVQKQTAPLPPRSLPAHLGAGDIVYLNPPSGSPSLVVSQAVRELGKLLKAQPSVTTRTIEMFVSAQRQPYRLTYGEVGYLLRCGATTPIFAAIQKHDARWGVRYKTGR